MSSPWATLLTSEEIAARHKLTESIDYSFARAYRLQMEGYTPAEHDSLAMGAWYANEGDAYQMHKSYAAIKRANQENAK